VPRKVEQINDYVFMDTYKSNKIKIGVNEMTVNGSEMCARCNVSFILRPCWQDNGYINGRLSPYTTNGPRFAAPSTNRGRRALTSVNVPLSKPWSPPRVFSH